MLETSSNEIVFSFSPNSPLVSTMNIKNTSSSDNLSFKMKTTIPELFGVSPSQGKLSPGQIKSISFKINKLLSKEEARDLVNKHKFLIQSAPFKQSQKSEVKGLISKYNAEDPSKLQNVRMAIKIEGLGRQDGLETPFETDSPNVHFDSGSHFKLDQTTDIKPTPELNNQLQELERREQRLVMQKQEAFGNATKGIESKSSSITLGKIMLFLMLFVIGFAANKLIRKQRIKIQQSQKPSVLVVTQSPVKIITEPTITHTVTQLPTQKARVIYVPETKQYKVQVSAHNRGVERDYSIKIGPDGVPRIIQL